MDPERTRFVYDCSQKREMSSFLIVGNGITSFPHCDFLFSAVLTQLYYLIPICTHTHTCIPSPPPSHSHPPHTYAHPHTLPLSYCHQCNVRCAEPASLRHRSTCTSTVACRPQARAPAPAGTRRGVVTPPTHRGLGIVPIGRLLHVLGLHSSHADVATTLTVHARASK